VGDGPSSQPRVPKLGGQGGSDLDYNYADQASRKETCGNGERPTCRSPEVKEKSSEAIEGLFGAGGFKSTDLLTY